MLTDDELGMFEKVGETDSVRAIVYAQAREANRLREQVEMLKAENVVTLNTIGALERAVSEKNADLTLLRSTVARLSEEVDAAKAYCDHLRTPAGMNITKHADTRDALLDRLCARLTPPSADAGEGEE